MAKVMIQPELKGFGRKGAQITEEDEDGEFGWWCLDCGKGSEKEGSGYQPMPDTIMAASMHVDGDCEGGK